MNQEAAYETAKDLIYNIDVRPAPVRCLVVCPARIVGAVERHFRSLLRPDLKLIEDNGCRFRFGNGGSVTILGRTGGKMKLFVEGDKVA